MDSSSNPMLKLYYTNRKVLFCMCAGNELFYVSLYLLHFSAGFFYYLTFMLAIIMAPIAIVKLGIALIQVSRLDVSKHKQDKYTLNQFFKMEKIYIISGFNDNLICFHYNLLLITMLNQMTTSHIRQWCCHSGNSFLRKIKLLHVYCKYELMISNINQLRFLSVVQFFVLFFV